MSAPIFPVQAGERVDVVIDQEAADLLNRLNELDKGEFGVRVEATVAMKEGLRQLIRNAQRLVDAEAVLAGRRAEALKA